MTHTARFEFRVSSEELRLIMKAAEKAGKSVSAFVREAAVKEAAKVTR